MGKTNFNDIFYLTHYIQNIIISTRKQYQRSLSYFTFFFFILSLGNPMCILHSIQRAPFLMLSGHIGSWLPYWMVHMETQVVERGGQGWWRLQESWKKMQQVLACGRHLDDPGYNDVRSGCQLMLPKLQLCRWLLRWARENSVTVSISAEVFSYSCNPLFLGTDVQIHRGTHVGEMWCRVTKVTPSNYNNFVFLTTPRAKDLWVL